MMMRLLLCMAALGAVLASPPASAATAQPPSILYLMCDDLRPNLAAYGFNIGYTPNLDKLAARSLVFNRAYTQFPFCAPSRNSFMSGRRPDRTKVWNFVDDFRMQGPDWTSMPEFFKNNGYFTSAAGKLYHPGVPPNFDPPSWSDEANWPGIDINWTLCGENSPNYCTPTVNDSNTYDENKIVDLGMQRLQHALTLPKPFWLGVGLHRPHWPWRMPSSFLDRMPSFDDIAVAKHPLPPVNVALMAMNYGTELKDPDWHCYNCTVTDDNARHYRRHYYAAISYADYKLGQVLDALEKSGRANNTIIVFHADHGYQLGEHNEWTKMTNFELAARVPLMMHVPWMPASFGQRTDVIVELIDMYKGVQGSSFAEVFTSPAVQPAGLQPFAQTQIPRCNCHAGKYGIMECGNCFKDNRTKFEMMGMSIRTAEWRYTAWVSWNGTALLPIWSNVRGRELYTHENDLGNNFDDFENENLAGNPQYASVVAQLHAQLQTAFSNDN